MQKKPKRNKAISQPEAAKEIETEVVTIEVVEETKQAEPDLTLSQKRSLWRFVKHIAQAVL